ncbi:hypothetical protein HanLR1_Chr05g0163131 [Helianthus annuus]|nr:hypothetical protein HanLR1_Chr05g0163131 [Helianthus annuus]
MYRKQHKKDLAQEAVKKRRRATKKPYSRLSWELLWKLLRRREVRNLKSVMLLGREMVLWELQYVFVYLFFITIFSKHQQGRERWS